MTKKRKIALIIRGFHNGGIEKVFETYYSRMDLSPYEIHIVTNRENLPEKKAYFESLGCVVHPMSPMRGHRIKLKNISEYKKFFKEGCFDVVHNNVPDNLLALYFAKKYGVPTRILHSHNMYTENFDKKNKLVAAVFRKGFALNTANATKLVAASEAAAQAAFAERSGEAVILNNAIELDGFLFSQQTREQLRGRLGISEEEMLLGHVGRYENDQKNQEFALKLFRMLCDRQKKCRLVMIGDGIRRPEFMKMAEDMGIADRVVFTGRVSNVNEYLSAMDVYLFPSRKEGLGIAGVEAQASGVRCIFSDRIPKEACIADDLVVLPITGEHAAEAWADAAESMMSGILERTAQDRLRAAETVRAAGYDIRTQTGKLDAMYRE